ncbi:Alpha/Beta hydrolase protein [Gaertneriomyces semiglobifer]|nr:Alpha/Beta hydrolase protein [Gaertneriomyces semiglobifer]
MDPLVPESFNHKYAWINGIRYHYVDEGSGELIFLCHGFPDLWYGWRYVIPHLVGQGYRVIAPDMRGYGETDAPYAKFDDRKALERYGLKNICRDMASLLDHVAGAGSAAIFIGHDWGGMAVWRMCLHHPERVKAVGAICTAFSPPNPSYIPPEDLVKAWPQFKYQLWFIKPETDAELDDNVDVVLRNIFQGAHEQTHLLDKGAVHLLPKNTGLSKKLKLSEKEYAYYVRQFQRRSFHGGLNYYRTRRINFDDERGLPGRVDHPALMVVATADPALPVSMAQKMHKYVPNVVTKQVEAGHWVQMEQSDALNKILVDWLRGIRNQQAKL